MSKHTSSRRSSTEWQQVIEAQSDSGQSAKHFCEDQAIGYASFCAWRRRLSQTAPTALLDVSHLVSASSAPTWHIELNLGDGVTLELRRG